MPGPMQSLVRMKFIVTLPNNFTLDLVYSIMSSYINIGSHDSIQSNSSDKKKKSLSLINSTTSKLKLMLKLLVSWLVLTTVRLDFELFVVLTTLDFELLVGW